MSGANGMPETHPNVSLLRETNGDGGKEKSSVGTYSPPPGGLYNKQRLGGES